MRAAIAAGEIDPRTVIFSLSELFPEGAAGGDMMMNASARGVGGGVFVDDFSSYELTNFMNPPQSLVSIDGQFNPAGYFIPANSRYGVATDAVMMNTSLGNPGGEPPMNAATPSPTRISASATVPMPWASV